MYIDRATLKNYAKGAMRLNYGSCVLAALIVSIITGINVSTVQQITELETGFFDTVRVSVNGVGMLIVLFVGNIFFVGGCRFFIENRDYQAPLSKVLFGFQNGHYGNVVWTMFLRDIKTYLWYLLLVVPGVIKVYEYRMIPYILAEQPDLPQRDAFAISKEIMMGHKMEAFILDLSFLGWMFFSVLTCNIGGIFWTAPYQQATNAEFYVRLRDNWMQKKQMGNPYGGQGETF